MVRARLWLTCAAAHDPVSPVLLQPAVIGWEAKLRQVDLTIERALKGPELLSRMKGWVTVDVTSLEEVLAALGRIKLLDERELVVEFETDSAFESALSRITEQFGDQVNLERLN
jgi:hypothetical protein